VNDQNLKPFEKGDDPRRNLEGRPSVKKLTAALISKLEEKDGEGYTKIMEKLISLAKAGNMKAIEVILDRVEGKVMQGLEHTGKDGGNLFTGVTINIKRTDGTGT